MRCDDQHLAGAWGKNTLDFMKYIIIYPKADDFNGTIYHDQLYIIQDKPFFWVTFI